MTILDSDRMFRVRCGQIKAMLSAQCRFLYSEAEWARERTDKDLWRQVVHLRKGARKRRA